MQPWPVLRETLREFRQDRCARLAAACTTYALLAFAPLVLVVVVAVASAVLGGAAARDGFVAEAGKLVGPDGAIAVKQVLDAGAAANPATAAAGFLLLAYSATAGFAALQDGLNTAWGVEAGPTDRLRRWARTRLVSLLLILGAGALLLASLVASAVLAAAARHTAQGQAAGLVWQGADLGVSLALATLVFATVYTVLPDARIHFRDVLVGAFGTAVLFTAGKAAIGLYLASRSTTATGGAGAILAVLAWTYYSLLVFFLGAEFTQVHATSKGRPLTPMRGARPVAA